MTSDVHSWHSVHSWRLASGSLDHTVISIPAPLQRPQPKSHRRCHQLPPGSFCAQKKESPRYWTSGPQALPLAQPCAGLRASFCARVGLVGLWGAVLILSFSFLQACACAEPRAWLERGVQKMRVGRTCRPGGAAQLAELGPHGGTVLWRELVRCLRPGSG